MLVICLNDGADIEWHTGEPNPLERILSKYDDPRVRARGEAALLARVYMVQADCGELEHIQNQYASVDGNSGQFFQYSIPIPTPNRVVRWYGDIARTILLNL